LPYTGAISLTRSSRTWLDFHRREPNFNRESDLLRHREPCSISNIGNQTSIANQPFNVIASLAGRESNSQIEIISARRGDPHRHSSPTQLCYVMASLAGRESNSQNEIFAARRGDPPRHSSAT
jgi:hypothetical protein